MLGSLVRSFSSTRSVQRPIAQPLDLLGDVDPLVGDDPLEQRVRVLERIVTDSGYTLASEIEALRDARPVATRRATAEIEEKI